MEMEEVAMNPFTRFDKDWALVSAGSAGKSNTMTISWGGAGTIWHKSVLYIFIRESRHTKEFVDSSDMFSVSFLDEKYRDALKLCGRKSGRDCDKWKEAGLTPVECDGTVYPKEASQTFICRKLAAVPVGPETFLDPAIVPRNYPTPDFHTMYIGEIVRIV